ncbi:MFS transporter [Desulforhopalus sp. IMCC35007]|uniref:MFS transporter n=1 Tax=Desulforhopalus sp. IMCC35007 TaxID=2569543 RepID=UPI0010AEC2D0|nr:MFS transporter [Desulforhopalus sp. IMCC35007]TKB08384.1 MFS transporter [Desulforhopalus sp. IMCC35007]
MENKTAQLSPFTIRNIQLFIAFRVFFNARFYYPVFTILFLDFGLTIEQFALLNTVWAITIVCAEVPSGALADILGRKNLIVATSCFMVLEMLLLAFVPLGNGTLIFWAFFLNRILSGLAEAMASGADEAIAYDSLVEHGLQKDWPKVLSLQMRVRSIASIMTMTLGALIYDPSAVNTVLSWCGSKLILDQQTTMRFPIYFTLILAILATISAMKMVEEQSQEVTTSRYKLGAAFRKVLAAGHWIWQTPFALVVILAGMFFDHILRMIVTMTSQYFRLIHLPEASFGIIGSAVALLGLVTPKIAEYMADNNSPGKNLSIVFVISMLGLFGMTGFYPYWGLIPVALIFVALTFVSFFTSHYLNKITASSQRATVLSFKGLAFNLAYGFIGFVFASTIAALKQQETALHPQFPTEQIADLAFIDGIGYFPWYGLICFILLLFYSWLRLRKSKESL